MPFVHWLRKQCIPVVHQALFQALQIQVSMYVRILPVREMYLGLWNGKRGLHGMPRILSLWMPLENISKRETTTARTLKTAVCSLRRREMTYELQWAIESSAAWGSHYCVLVWDPSAHIPRTKHREDSLVAVVTPPFSEVNPCYAWEFLERPGS